MNYKVPLTVIIIVGLGFLFLAIRGILRRKYEFGFGRIPSRIFVLQGSAAVVTAFIHGIGAMMMTIPYVVEITAQWPDYPLFLPLVFAGFIIIAMGFIVGWMLFQFHLDDP